MQEMRTVFDAADAEAQKRVARALEENATELSLANLPIDSLPLNIGRLTTLTSLDLSRCGQLQNLQPLTALTNLQSLNLKGCGELRNLRPLSKLTSLQSLDLSGCRQLRDLGPLSKLTSLRFLKLTGCRQLQNLQPLAALTSLKSLKLSGCGQLQNLQPLSKLTTLQFLQLSSNGQLQDLQPLSKLASLRSIRLTGCRQLQNVQPLAALTSLRSISLSNCQQLNDLQPLAALTRLRSLQILGCRLDCSPTAVPISSWPRLSALYCDNVVGAPSELGSKGLNDNALHRIRAWQKDLLVGEAPNSTLKVFILGNGRVGKTQIWRRLLGREFDPAIPFTHGIALEEVRLAPAQVDEPEVRARLWDFGGQSIYLGTHALFLDDRAIYVIAWAPQYENTEESEQSGILMRNRPLTYWLEYVRSLAGPGAPVVVMQTQCDHETNVKAPALPTDHGFERLQITYSSAKQTDGIERLQLELKSAARYQLERYGKVRLPLSWCSIAQDLEVRRHQKTIPYTEFETLARTKHKSAAAGAVLEYLHRSGEIFYRSGAFDNQLVLDLDWALDGIYAVFNRDKALPIIRRQAGRFSPQLLAALAWPKYGQAEHNLFLSLMRQCQICFRVAEDVYVAPDLLPPESETSAGVDQIWRGATPDAVADLHYSFLHEGVLRAVLCGLGDKAGVNAVYWAYGICFYDLESKSTARIRSEYSDPTGSKAGGRVSVEVAGLQASELAKHLVASILRVNIGTRPEVIWTRGEPQVKRQDEVADSTKADEPFAGVNPVPVPRSAGELQPVYVSYAWVGESEALVDQFEAKLPKSLKLIRDKRVLRPGDWISDFMLEIGRSDCVLVVISEKYLRSFYCMRELLHVYQRSLQEKDVFLDSVVPLTVGDVRFSRALERAEHARYWQQEDEKLDARLARLDRLSIGDADRAEQLAIKDFAHRISDILSWVSDTLMPRGVDVQSKGIDAAIDLILARIQRSERKARQTYSG